MRMGMRMGKGMAMLLEIVDTDGLLSVTLIMATRMMASLVLALILILILFPVRMPSTASLQVRARNSNTSSSTGKRVAFTVSEFSE